MTAAEHFIAEIMRKYGKATYDDIERSFKYRPKYRYYGAYTSDYFLQKVVFDDSSAVILVQERGGEREKFWNYGNYLSYDIPGYEFNVMSKQ